MALGLIFYAGYGFGLRRGSGDFIPSVISNSNSGQPANVDFSLFWQTWNKVRDSYNNSSDPQSMVYGAISGMVSSLGDPYTEFLKPSDNKALTSDLSGQLEGIGAELTMDNDAVTVIAPLASSPAEKAGIKARDIILMVDETSTNNLTLTEVVNKIRGAAGTQVKLEIQHAGASTPINLTIIRAKITVPSVTYGLNQDGNKKIATFTISQFGDDTSSLVEKFANQAISDKADGIILDLRDNPGGYLDSAVTVAGVFLPNNKLVVSEVDKNGKKQEYKTSGAATLANLPLIVLVNGGSASASEILTGAIKDNKRGEIIGEKTFGKGCVQQIIPLSGGSALKVTIANWLTPNGSQINKIGITPDVVVTSPTDNSSDPQMEKAKLEITK